MESWCRIEIDGVPVFGVIDGQTIELIDGDPFQPYKRTGQRVSIDGVKFLPPVIPQNFYAIGVNYRAHIEWANQNLGMSLKVPTQADVGYRSANALVGSGAEIVIPKGSLGPIHFEGELVAVIGRRAKRLSAENALSCIAGYTLGNDLSERSFQSSDRTLWRAKNMDTFKPMGPIVVPQLDPGAQEIAVRVNHQVVASYNTRHAIFTLQQYIERMTSYVTLWPGDVIWLGCDGPTLPDLKPGDLVEVVNEKIGVLSNRVSAEI